MNHSTAPGAATGGIGLVLTGLLIMGMPAGAEAQEQTQRLTAAAPTTGARFGDSVDVAGRTMVVGASGAGTVHVFRHVRGAGFGEVQVLVTPSGTSTSRFGFRVALDEPLLAVGAPGEEAVYVFTRQPDGSFGAAVRVQAAVAQAGARFGETLALRGGRLVVGARLQDGRTGSVHVFARQGDGSFAGVAELRPAGVGSGDEFGSAVALDGDGSTLFASAVQDDDGATDAGAVYVLEESAGAFGVVAKLVAPDAAYADRAGRALACAGDLLAVGVRNDDDVGRESGSVVLWDRSGGAFAHAGKLLAPDGLAGDLFGHRVVLRGDRVLVGAVARDSASLGYDVGRAYLFERDAAGALVFARSFDSPAPQAFGYFGSAVALSDHGLAVGGRGADGGAGEVLSVMRPVQLDPAQSTVSVNPETIDVGQEALVTVVPRDEWGDVYGPGLSVTVTTTLGALQGSVADQGDGRYTQWLLGDVAGTAEVGAVVEGHTLPSTATLSVVDPLPPARVVGQRRDGSFVPFGSIQSAVDAAGDEDLVGIMVVPGTYEEVVRVDGQQGLTLSGLASHGTVTVRGLRVTNCVDVVVEGLHLRPAARGLGGVGLGPCVGNERVVLRGLFVDGTRGGHAGIHIGAGNRDVALQGCRVDGAAGDGILVTGRVTGLEVLHCTVTGSGRNGLELSRAVEDAFVAQNTLVANGRRGSPRDGYGVLRQGGNARSARPEEVTLVGNDVRRNAGHARRGRSTPDFGRYDLMIDRTDRQAPFQR